MHAVFVTRTSLRRRLAQPQALSASAGPLQRSWAAALSPLATQMGWQQSMPMSASSAATGDGASPPKIIAAKALAARLRRKSKKKVVVKTTKTDTEQPHVQAGSGPTPFPTTKTGGGFKNKKRNEEEALLAAAATSVEADGAAMKVAVETTESESTSEKEKKSGSALVPIPVPAKRQQQPKLLKDLETDKITMTLKEIASLQKQLPSVDDVAAIVAKMRRESFFKGQTLFDLYRIYGNPFLDEQFLTPGVLACCEAKKPAQGIQIVRDMLEQGRKVEESTLRALLDVCDQTSAAREVIELWGLMGKAGVKLNLKDLNLVLEICHRKEYLEGAIKVLKELRLQRPVSVHSYMHWLNQATLVWRADAFFDLLMEMRLSGVEPEILSLTSLESGRMDRALTVMEGVRAVGLDPCFAMSAVFSSMQYSVYKNGPAAEAITPGDVTAAKNKFGELRAVEIDWPTKPIPQVLETQAAGLILQQETFRRLKLSQVHRIDELLQLLPITTNMTINLRKQLQRMSLLVNTHRVKRNARKIVAEFDSGKSLIELSSLHNYPPVSLMRIILKERGLSTIGIKRALGAPSSHLAKRDQNELRKASSYDSIHRSDPFIGRAMYNADSLETTIEHFLRSRGIRFKTEDELGDEQHAKYGRRVLSPDILLLDPVVINGTPIRWIDAKNYYGAHIVSKRLISRQLASYVNEWGPGAIVFGMGFSDMFSLPGVICLDTTPFPKTGTEIAKMRTKSMFQSMLNMLSWKKHLGSELTQEYPADVGRGHSHGHGHGHGSNRSSSSRQITAADDVDELEELVGEVEAEAEAQQQEAKTNRSASSRPAKSYKPKDKDTTATAKKPE